MMELLSEKYGVKRERMAIAGFADTVPLKPNDTQEGRAQNRRWISWFSTSQLSILRPLHPRQLPQRRRRKGIRLRPMGIRPRLKSIRPRQPINRP